MGAGIIGHSSVSRVSLLSVAAASICFFVFFGCSSEDTPTETIPLWTPVVEDVVGSEGGTVAAGSFSLEIPEGAISDDVTVSVGSQPIQEHPLLDARLTGDVAVYQICGLGEFAKSLTIELAVDPADWAGTDSVFVYFEEEVYMDSGVGISQHGRPLLDSVLDRDAGVVRATIPAHIFEDPEQRANKNELFDMVVGVSFGGNLEIETFNSQYTICWSTDLCERTFVEELVLNLSDSRDSLEALGFEFCRSSLFPVEVHVKSIDGADGMFVQSKLGVNFSILEIDPALEGVQLRASIGHEFFHMFQQCYGVCGHYFGYSHKWLSEACSVWFEGVLLNDPTFVSTVQAGNRDFITKGFETNTAGVGYGAAVFLTWLTDKFDRDLIVEINQEVESDPALPGGGVRAVDAVLRQHDTQLSLEFRTFAQEFMLGTTEHNEWTYPAPEYNYFYPSTPPQSYHFSMMDLSANAIVTALNWGDETTPTGVLTISIADDIPPFVEAFVYTSELNNGPWVLAGTAISGSPLEIYEFGTGAKKKAKTVLINSKGSLLEDDIIAVDIMTEFEVVEPLPDVTAFNFVTINVRSDNTYNSGGVAYNDYISIQAEIAWNGHGYDAYTATDTLVIPMAFDSLVLGPWSGRVKYDAIGGNYMVKRISGYGIPLDRWTETSLTFEIGGEETCGYLTGLFTSSASDEDTPPYRYLLSHTCRDGDFSWERSGITIKLSGSADLKNDFR